MFKICHWPLNDKKRQIGECRHENLLNLGFNEWHEFASWYWLCLRCILAKLLANWQAYLWWFWPAAEQRSMEPTFYPSIILDTWDFRSCLFRERRTRSCWLRWSRRNAFAKPPTVGCGQLWACMVTPIMANRFRQCPTPLLITSQSSFLPR